MTRASPHLISYSAVGGQSKDQVGQGIGMSGFNDAAALVLLDQPCDLAVVVARLNASLKLDLGYLRASAEPAYRPTA
jgi:hypothetical protein